MSEPHGAAELPRRGFAFALPGAMEISLRILPILLTGVITTTACYDGDGTSLVVGPGGDTTTERGVGSVSDNHGHVATIPSADLNAGNALTVDIRGTADHSHFVDLTADEVVQIRGDQRVTATSTTDASAMFGAHSHTVTWN
jgi:hypothetical protein